MKSFETKSLAIFGRLPNLSLAELESLYGPDHLQPIPGGALLDLPTQDIKFMRLGGTIKLAKFLTILPTTRWDELEKFLVTSVPRHLQQAPEGNFTLGVSLYNFNVPINSIHRALMSLKKIIKKSGRSVRIVPNKAPELNSAQVLHNKLTTQGAWELLFLKDGNRTIVAQTIFVQDIEAYAARDQARPKRDARIGMLPPKLAQTMINVVNPGTSASILDPFCGTGVVLQEALLMGYGAIGSDKDERMVRYTIENIDWLKQKYPQIEFEAALEIGDATTHKWPRADAIVSEIYLGRPLTGFPPPDVLQQIRSDVNTIFKKFLINLAPQIKSGTKLCLAVPAWRMPGGGYTFLPVLDHLTDMGYNYLDLAHVARMDLIYFREDQTVARQLLTLIKG